MTRAVHDGPVDPMAAFGAEQGARPTIFAKMFAFVLEPVSWMINGISGQTSWQRSLKRWKLTEAQGRAAVKQYQDPNRSRVLYDAEGGAGSPQRGPKVRRRERSAMENSRSRRRGRGARPGPPQSGINPAGGIDPREVRVVDIGNGDPMTAAGMQPSSLGPAGTPAPLSAAGTPSPLGSLPYRQGRLTATTRASIGGNPPVGFPSEPGALQAPAPAGALPPAASRRVGLPKLPGR